MDYKDEILAKIPTFLNMLEGSSLAGYIACWYCTLENLS